MASMQTKAAKAVIDLNAAVIDITNWYEMPVILETVIKKIFPIDWLLMANFSESAEIYNIVTNPCLPFDWNEKYASIAEYDVIRKNAFKLDRGHHRSGGIKSWLQVFYGSGSRCGSVIAEH